MGYTEYRPHPALAAYVDAYWQFTGDGMPATVQRILPDGCVDIIVNVGDDQLPGADGFFMKSGQSYLVGTMSHSIDSTVLPHSHLIGIRFRPAGFPAFYRYGSLHEFTDLTVEFDNQLAPDLRRTDISPKICLDNFLLKRLGRELPRLIPAIGEIEYKNGLIDVPTLARNHCTTVRQLQRAFKEQVGLSPKEFINVIRFRYAMQLIKTNDRHALLDIALEAGYYDHAHLTNAIRKYAGVAPSSL
nr:helix-turn-helix transcriptional regulator [uncultured Dyadobacter sp.]